MRESSLIALLTLCWPVQAISLSVPSPSDDVRSFSSTVPPLLLATQSSSPFYLLKATAPALELTALNPPPGFSINLVFNGQVALSPIGVYSVALDTIYRLSIHEWSDTIRRSVLFALPDYAENIVFLPNNRGSSPSKRLLNGYAILALYAGVCAMTPPTRNLFFELKVVISKDRVPVGRCNLQLSDPGLRLPHNSSSEPVLARAGTSSHGILSANTGSITDPEDRRFRITYTFRNTRINSRHIFLAAIDGIAAAARMSAASRCGRLTGTTPNEPRNPAVVTVSASESSRGFRLTWQYASRTVLLITRLMQAEGRFEGITFSLEHDGASFGEGFVA